jgi:hypothetical protein
MPLPTGESYTAHLNLIKFVSGFTNWASAMNANLDLLDSVITENASSGQGTLAQVSDLLLTSTSPTQLFSLAIAEDNYMVALYYRVINPDSVLVTMSYNDGGGVQTVILTTGPVPSGSYRTIPFYFTAVASSTVAVTATAGIGSNVYVSVSLTQS